MPPRAGGQHQPPRADNAEGKLKLYGVAVWASPRLRAPGARCVAGVSHAGERDRFRCAPRLLGSSRGITGRGHNDGSLLTPLSTYSRTTRSYP